jgi:hypothetical protein
VAIAGRDQAALRALFATPVEFRAVTPRRFWDAETPSEVADIVLGTWFDESKQTTDLCLVEDDAVGDALKVSYRMSVLTDAGPTLIEQVIYYAEQDGRITHLRLVCSGFRPA